MAQRVFLIQTPVDVLTSVCGAICGSSDDRQKVSQDLARASMPHFRRAAASERTAAAAEARAGERGVELPDAWGLARNCMPYLCASRKAEDILARLEAVSAVEGDDALEDFFGNEIRSLGVEPGSADRHKFSTPKERVVQEWIAGLLDQAAALRQKAFDEEGSRAPRPEGDDDPFIDFAISSWVWLGQIFARSYPAFWQGRNRWLGNAAFPEVFDVRSTVVSIQPEPPSVWARMRSWLGRSQSDEGLDAVLAASRAQTRASMATAETPELRDILVSTSGLVPRLGIESARETLPPEGSANLASGAVPLDGLDSLVSVMRAMQRESERIPYENGEEWVELVIAAATAAHRARAHLVEGDDAIYGAYRWPLLDCN